MIKASFYSGQTEKGPVAIPLTSGLAKEASPALVSEVSRYISTLRPSGSSIYVLVNAMGAGEYYGSNINGDYFTEACLIHAPDGWTGNPLLDKLKAKSWPYGYPTFYLAHPYAHHRNKDPSRAYGEVELAAWNQKMHRVELVVRVDKDKCEEFGGVGVWDKLKQGQYPDVSMGCVPAGTLITMGDGTRLPIEQVQIGDLVLTHLGRARRVTQTHCRPYKGELYSIHPEAHETLRATHRHPFWAVDDGQVKTTDTYRRWREDVRLHPEWVHTECLEAHHLLEPILDETLTPDFADRAFCRLFGYYLAEGHVLRDKNKTIVGIQLTTHRDDPVHAEIEALCSAFGTKNPPTTSLHPETEESRNICIFDPRLARLCHEHGGGYAKKKKLSYEALRWHPDLQREILGAYANGDGCGGSDGSLKLSTASTDLAWQWMTVLPRLAVLASIQNLEHKAGSGFSARATYEWVIHIGKQWAQALRQVCQKVQPVEILKAKNSRKVLDGYIATPIRSVDSLYVETEVFNLEVEEDESYLAAGIATHNCKVPFDTCSICLDWDKYRSAQATFDRSRHKSPGDAILAAHKALKLRNGHGIRGVSITRADYCEHAKKQMNRILPDGRKVFVYNDYPRFFDISFVFIGADKTAKVMMKIAEGSRIWSLPAAELAEKLGYSEGPAPAPAFEKTAGVREELLKSAFFGKAAKEKDSEITKDVLPSQFASKAVPLLTQCEPDLPENVIHALGSAGLGPALSTAGGLGIVLRPHEFERVVIISMGSGPAGKPGLDADLFSPALARLLVPLMAMRSALGPEVERRVLVATQGEHNAKKSRASLSKGSLDKIGSAYNGYRNRLMELVASAQEMMGRAAALSEPSLHKLAQAPASEVFTPLSVAYLKHAFMDELGGDVGRPQAQADVQRAELSRNTWTTQPLSSGEQKHE